MSSTVHAQIESQIINQLERRAHTHTEDDEKHDSHYKDDTQSYNRWATASKHTDNNSNINNSNMHDKA